MPRLVKHQLHEPGLELNIESSSPSMVFERIIGDEPGWEELMSRHTMVHYVDPNWMGFAFSSTTIYIRKKVMALLKFESAYVTSVVHEETQKRLIKFLNSDKVTWKN